MESAQSDLRGKDSMIMFSNQSLLFKTRSRGLEHSGAKEGGRHCLTIGALSHAHRPVRIKDQQTRIESSPIDCPSGTQTTKREQVIGYEYSCNRFLSRN